MNRRIQIVAAVGITIVVAAIFYYAFIAPRRAHQGLPTQPNENTENASLRHPLTGMAIATSTDFFAVSVMYDNFETVKKRPGLESAGVVYEALAEGGITRLMAVFDSTSQVKRFGPIRSVRPYFVDWASEYGGLLMHVGGSPEALSLLRTTDLLVDIDQIGAREMYFERDETLRPPHNVFSSFSSWLKLGDRLDIKQARFTPWRYAEHVATSISGFQEVRITYSPDTAVSWLYSQERAAYIRYLNGVQQVSAVGEPLTAANVVVIEVPSETIDAIGRQRMRTVGSGLLEVYRGGERVKGTWIKETRSSRMRLVSDAQEEIALQPGTTWVMVVPSLQNLTVETRE